MGSVQRPPGKLAEDSYMYEVDSEKGMELEERQ